MVDAVRPPALRVSAFVISGADMGVFHPMGVPVFSSSGDPREKVPLRHVPAQRSPYCDVLLNCSCGTCGHTLGAVLYCHEVIGAVSNRLPPLEIK